MNWKDSKATRDDMAKRLDEAYKLEADLGGNPMMLKKLRPPEEPKEELPEEVDDAIQVWDSKEIIKTVDYHRGICKALLSHIKSEPKGLEERVKELERQAIEKGRLAKQMSERG